jgi:hypothetical protein
MGLDEFAPGWFVFLRATGARTIRVPDSEAELLRALSAQLQNALRLATDPEWAPE